MLSLILLLMSIILWMDDNDNDVADADAYEEL